MLLDAASYGSCWVALVPAGVRDQAVLGTALPSESRPAALPCFGGARAGPGQRDSCVTAAWLLLGSLETQQLPACCLAVAGPLLGPCLPDGRSSTARCWVMAAPLAGRQQYFSMCSVGRIEKHLRCFCEAHAFICLAVRQLHLAALTGCLPHSSTWNRAAGQSTTLQLQCC